MVLVRKVQFKTAYRKLRRYRCPEFLGFTFSVSKGGAPNSNDLDSLKHIRVGVKTKIIRWRELEGDIDICLVAKPRPSFFPYLDEISVLTFGPSSNPARTPT